MKPVWYVQPRQTDQSNTQQIIYTIQEMGMEVFCEKYVPFNGMDWSFLPADRPVIGYGSIATIKSLLRGWNGNHFYPGAWCDWDVLLCRSYYAHWGKYLLQKDYGFYPLGEIYRLKDYLYEKYGRDDTIFVRPDTNNKTFTGEKIYKKNFDIWQAKLVFDTEPVETMCVVAAQPVKIHAEYRLIIADKKVVTGSKYRDDEVICYEGKFPDEMGSFAEDVAKTWSPHAIYCLDIAETEFGLKVVECGSVNCAGYYACDIKKIIIAMVNVAEREWEETWSK